MENVVTAPKTESYHFRINPEIRRQMEAIYAKNGISFTQAINIFIQQSLNDNGLPFLASPENAEFMRTKAMRRLLEEAQKGWDSAEKEGWLSIEALEAQLGSEDE